MYKKPTLYLKSLKPFKSSFNAPDLGHSTFSRLKKIIGLSSIGVSYTAKKPTLCRALATSFYEGRRLSYERRDVIHWRSIFRKNKNSRMSGVRKIRGESGGCQPGAGVPCLKNLLMSKTQYRFLRESEPGRIVRCKSHPQQPEMTAKQYLGDLYDSYIQIVYSVLLSFQYLKAMNFSDRKMCLAVRNATSIRYLEAVFLTNGIKKLYAKINILNTVNDQCYTDKRVIMEKLATVLQMEKQEADSLLVSMQLLSRNLEDFAVGRTKEDLEKLTNNRNRYIEELNGSNIPVVSVQIDNGNCFSKTFRKVYERLGDCPRVSRISRKISYAMDCNDLGAPIKIKKASSFAT